MMSLASTGLFDFVTTDSLMAVFNSVTDLLPVIFPVTVAFAGFYKAWGFLKNQLHG